MKYESILLEVKDRIAYITINSPKTLNALNIKIKDEIDFALDFAQESEDVLGIILTGTGKSFSSGADLQEVAMLKRTYPEDGTRNMRARTHQLFLRLHNFPKPTVAAINGYAFGGGAELSLCCDFRIASEKAVFCLPEVKMGMMPGFGGTQMLPRVIRPDIAKELLYSGRTVSAQEGKEIGLYSNVCPHDSLLSSATEFLQTMIKNGPIAIRCIKQAVNLGLELSLGNAFALEAELCDIPSMSEDAKEGAAAFREKRAPIFNNR